MGVFGTRELWRLQEPTVMGVVGAIMEIVRAP